MKKCPFCKIGYLERKTMIETYHYREQKLEIEQSGEFCNSCEEGILDANDLKSTDKAIRTFRAKVDGLFTPDEIRQIRKKLGLTQKQAAHLCGGGVNAFSRYERGDVTPVRAVNNLFKLLNNPPEFLKELTNSKI
ncbi:type II toxin-antitoxin system MqsA family antitoxin [Candidatus Albibeggiatoa sp. nov. BB20]|uniref:type II toxin-antitoxin system MqsA family antitoxin n=1 Tax=Candidatus Albibeggiatoa sp. nov. BB20 TaxID=3162723 RepID=UPI003365410D